MADRLRWKSWVTGALVLAAAAGCAGSDADTPPSTSKAPAPTTTAASTSPTPSESPTEAAAAAAEDVVTRYYATLDEIRAHPEMPLTRLRSVAVSVQLNAQLNLVRHERKMGLHQIGETRIVEMTVQSVNLDDSNAAAGKVPTVAVDVCLDVSAVDIVRSDGKSVVSPDRADRGWTRYLIANYQDRTHSADGWRVASGQDLGRTPCSGA